MLVENDFYDFAEDADTVKCIFCKKIVPTDRAIWLGTVNIRREKMYACGCTTPDDDLTPATDIRSERGSVA